MAGRVRGTRGARRRHTRRLRRGGRIGRAHTTSIKARFGVDAATGWFWKPGDNTNSTGTAFTSVQELNAYINVASANQAVVYQFDFPLTLLVGQNPAYTAFSVAWDRYRIDKVAIKLTCSLDPKRMLTQTMSTSASNQYNFSGELQYDPDITWVDRDGSLAVNPTGGYALQANGDCSDEVVNRSGSKSHRAFSTIYRSMRPRANIAIAAETTGRAFGQPSALTAMQYVNTKLNPFRTTFNQNAFLGAIMLAISYKGPNLSSGIQPQYAWSCRTMWWMTMASPLFG